MIQNISDVNRCPRRALIASHYDEDGRCGCCGDLGAGQVTGAEPCVLDRHEAGGHRDRNGFTWGEGEAL